MFGGQHRIDEAETARASWGDTSETRQPWRRDPRAVGKVCSWTEKIRIKSLETAGVVRDNAETGQVIFFSRGRIVSGIRDDHGCRLGVGAMDEPKFSVSRFFRFFSFPSN